MCAMSSVIHFAVGALRSLLPSSKHDHRQTRLRGLSVKRTRSNHESNVIGQLSN